MKYFPLFIILVFGVSFQLKSQIEIEGLVQDSISNEPIPYTNVWVKKTSKGTLTNDNGRFSLTLDSVVEDSIEFSLIGYDSKTFNTTYLIEHPNQPIRLSPKVFELKTAIVTPLTAQEYVRRSIIYKDDNYNTKAKKGRYYYREVIRENSNYNRFTEAVLDVYQPPNNADKEDTSIINIKGGHVLDNRQYIEFMRDYVKKKVDKYNKKREKKGEETKEFTDATEYISFSNPYLFVDSSLTTRAPSFLDSNHFDKYEYQFEYGYESKGRQMLCISFNQIKKLNDTYYQGLIYMVDSSFAIEGIDYGLNEKGRNKFFPGWVKAALWVYRLEVENPDLQAKIRFNELNGKWGLSHYFINLSGTLTKKYFFDENETSTFNINQSFVFIETINSLNEKDQLLIRKKSLHDQIKSSNPNIDWKKYRKLEPENLHSK